MVILPFLAMCFMALKGFVLQLVWMFMLFISYFAANRTTFSSILPCI